VLLVLVEMLRRQNRRDHRDSRLQLHPHQAADHRLGNKLIAVDAAVDHKARGNDSRVTPALREQRRMERNFKRAGDLIEIDVILGKTALRDLLRERDAAAIDNLLVPARLHKGDTTRAHVIGLIGWFIAALIHRAPHR